jgi:membrane-associated phospholipid phosphatase
MNTDLANELNTAVLGAAVGWLDWQYPRGNRGDDVLQGQLLYWSGLVTLKGLQAGVKGAVGRQRPLPRLWPDVAAARAHADPGHDRASFWSGHASGAFYGATFLNLRLRGALRRELSAGDWGDWRWAPPTLLYGWAAWVAYSRIHAHQHYVTDVLAGALMGTALAIVFEALDPQGRGEGGGVPLGAVVLRF